MKITFHALTREESEKLWGQLLRLGLAGKMSISLDIPFGIDIDSADVKERRKEIFQLLRGKK